MFMHKYLCINVTTNTFITSLTSFIKLQHKHPKKFSINSFCVKIILQAALSFQFLYAGPKLRNEVLYKEEKNIQSGSPFQSK